ncbi:hypothetical protein K466DRAFT_657155 [Polyporus arcularius HHB13444]|uniref:Uncharacterized protein n=1 Tax=Polyporus arcularius HHB13444 TaxID=1314778 RepID=A0A5C3NM66_9APHY|nr:hypothetical protein K466DRAFT_657155 [Polyporus arcularius HHB13444]
MTSASASATVHVPFRVFHITEGIYPDSPIALGRSHASWFLISTRPDGLAGFRVVRCLNTIIPGDRSTVGLFSAAGRHLFAVGGTFGEKAVNHLTHLRDTEGRAPVKVVQTYPKDHSFGFCALVEVHVPDEELMYACARCGRWETELGPRFQRCSGCKSRCYCSAKSGIPAQLSTQANCATSPQFGTEKTWQSHRNAIVQSYQYYYYFTFPVDWQGPSYSCQKDDWKPAYHRGECDLLEKGKHYEVEHRRKLHDNGWWFHRGGLGNQALMEPTGEYERECAETEGDWDWIAYGQRHPPHDVPLSAGARPTFSKDYVASLPPGVPPPGFVSTGSAEDNQRVLKRWRATVLGTDKPIPSRLNPMRTPGLMSNVVLERDIPPMPEMPVPKAPGFVFTGDPPLDERRLHAFLVEHGTEAELMAFWRVARAWAESVEVRTKLVEEKERRSKEYRELAVAHLTAVKHNWQVRSARQRAGLDVEEDDSLFEGML